MAQHRCYARGVDPCADFLPGFGAVKHSGDQVVADTCAVEHAGDFRRRAGLAICQPFSGHFFPARQPIERFIVDARRRLQVEHHNRHLRLLYYRQDGGTECIGRDIKEDDFYLLAGEQLRSAVRLIHRVYQSSIHNGNAGALKPAVDRCLVAFQALFQPLKLRPVRVQTNAKQTDLDCWVIQYGHYITS